jgi:CRISPR/Cas system CSM-associated protein Csm3 (group 7 of RAMP superfamily)
MNRGDLENARKIVERIVVTGDLLLETPTRFGNGDSTGLVDLTIARDPLAGQALLPGASIAGALRSYLRTRERGFRTVAGSATLEKLLFGFEEGAGGSQSYLVAHDSLCDDLTTELRDGVAIDPKTRTAVDDKKYDIELLAAGTTFPLRVELLVAAGQEAALMQALAVALQGFERGEIPMGARRRRGFGRCRVREWRVQRYRLTEPAGLIAWLRTGDGGATPAGQRGAAIAPLLGVAQTALDRRQIFTVEALFGIAGSLLIRSSSEAADAPDMVHLHSRRGAEQQAIVSGTSLAGALRARARRIVMTIGDEKKADRLINDLFGPQIAGSNDKPRASRLWVAESEIKNPLELVVSRVKIDRFTGGSFPTALFSQQPVFGVAETAVELTLRLQNPTVADKGLLLLLLKDLWTEDLPLGGEASVGRGRLSGKCAKLVEQDGEAEPQEWALQQADGRLTIQGEREEMQRWVDQLWQEVQP